MLLRMCISTDRKKIHWNFIKTKKPGKKPVRVKLYYPDTRKKDRMEYL